MGILWQRMDLTQKHHHWTRKGGPVKTSYQANNSKMWWDHDKKIFERKKSEEFRFDIPEEFKKEEKEGEVGEDTLC
jgi:hypothetical protein